MEYIQSVSCTDDGQIICITTKYAILLFETTKLAFIVKIDNLPKEFTNKISNCKLLYNTRILGFIYHEKIMFENGSGLKRDKFKNFMLYLTIFVKYGLIFYFTFLVR